MKTTAGKNIPVDPDSVDDEDETDFDPKRHISHFATCPNVNQHRKRK